MCREIKRESVCVCERVKRDIKGPLPVRVRLGYGLGYQAFCPVFQFLTFCSLAFCPGFDLVYTVEIRGQPLVLLYKMILYVCRLARENCRTDLQNSFWEL